MKENRMNRMNRIIATLAATLSLFHLPVAVLAREGDDLPAVPASIAVPGGYEVAVRFSASGVQIYRCQPSATDATALAWKFVAPEATLFDYEGHIAGHHYAGPTWEANDGSKILGTVVAKAPAPDGMSIPWLLLSASVVTPGRTLGHAAFVQRLHTVGGAAPATGCGSDTANTEIRVPYTADYYFHSLD
jgi:hypothetical protein